MQPAAGADTSAVMAVPSGGKCRQPHLDTSADTGGLRPPCHDSGVIIVLPPVDFLFGVFTVELSAGRSQSAPLHVLHYDFLSGIAVPCWNSNCVF